VTGDVQRTSNDMCVETGNGVDCEQAVHELYHYLRRRADPDEAQRDRRAPGSVRLVFGCAEFEAELRQVIANHCRDHVPDSLRERIAASIHEEQHRHGSNEPGTD